MKYVPKRGDIIFTNFNPSAGHEEAYEHPALVLSPEPFNHHIQLALVAPITSKIRGHGFEVKLDDSTQTQGVVLCQQVRTIDYNDPGAKFIELAPEKVVNETLARVKALLN